ncbi:MAG: class I SAM-dependent methyltransferase [Acetobacteraceae bacterium]|nr:class I SAM-dependent methyltransferase [Acetobacteraceae bacterium]
MSYIRSQIGDRAGLRVLDVACGAGHFGFTFADIATTRISFFDASASMLRAVKDGAATRGIEVETVVGLAEVLPFDDESFDLVVSRLAPHHFLDPCKATKEMARVLSPGGQCAIIDLEGPFDGTADVINCTIETLHDPTHVRSYSQLEWCKFMRSADLLIEAVQGGLRESPEGVTVERWCEIASTDSKARADIEAVLIGAPARELAMLGIWHDGEGYRVPIRTTLIFARKPSQ